MALLLTMGGCENTIEPFAEKGQYSIYGYLSPARPLQMVRVKPLTVPITKMDSASLDVTVILENRTAGTSEVLVDSVIVFQDAQTTVVTHNFWTDTPIIPGSKYRLSVEGPNGEETRATTLAPTGIHEAVSPPDGNCLDHFTVVFEGIDLRRLFKASIEVRFDDEWIAFPREDLYQTAEGHAALNVKPEDLLEPLIDEQSLPDERNPTCWFAPRCAKLESDTLRVKYTFLGPEWYGDIPEESLTYDPLSSQDVSNGLGFFGALGQGQTSVPVDTARVIPLNSPFCNP